MDATPMPWPSAPELRTARLRLRAVVPDDTPDLRAIVATPAVARWFHQPDESFPFDFDDDTARWTIELARASELGPAGAVIGMIQAYEGADPDYDECGIDVVRSPSLHRRGLGTEVVTAVRDWLVGTRGHHRVVIDPAAENEGAIACYRGCGFVPVGLLHGRERDTDGPGWHDSLLMEYVVPPPSGSAAATRR